VRLENRSYLLLAALIILADQLSKLYIRSKLVPGESMPVLDNFLRFTFIYNPAGVFGIHIGNIVVYTILSILAAAIVAVYFFKIPAQFKFGKICLATVFGGAIGNLIDRILYGKVIDFIDVNIFDIVLSPFTFLSFKFDGFALYRWYIFNIADAAITLGLIGFIIFLLLQDKLYKTDSSEAPPEINLT
jgi:signal peptidase II